MKNILPEGAEVGSPRSNTWKRIKILLAVALWLLPTFAIRAQLTYTTNGNTLTVSGYKGSIPNPGALTIPETSGGRPVVAIGKTAFDGRQDLKSVTIPNGVTNIGYFSFWSCFNLTSLTLPNSLIYFDVDAFGSCGALTNLTIPDSVKRIGPAAFDRCKSLMNVTIPNSVTNLDRNAFSACTALTNVSIGNSVTIIDASAFEGCPNLVTLVVDDANPSFSSRDGVLFNKDQTVLFIYPAGSATSYSIPNSVTRLASSSFNNCHLLKSIRIGDNVTNIDAIAFYYCYNLKKVTIPKSVNSIGDAAFGLCYSLESVTFEGDSPKEPVALFSGVNPVVYYLPGTTGWGPTFGGAPTRLWNPTVSPVDSSFGVLNGMFGFNIAGTPGITIIVEASTNLARGPWVPVSTNTLTGGTSYFTDSGSVTNARAFFRFRTP